MLRNLLAAILLLFPLALHAQDTTAPEQQVQPEAAMTLDRLDKIIRALDPDAKSNGHVWQLMISDTAILIVTDETANRMRAITPIRKSADISPEEMTRMMQANFDSALDARYAIAQETLWAAFIHPLSPLEKDEFISGLGQVVNLAQSYGTLYSGGALQYGGGDSGAIQRKLIDDLLKKGQEI
ncbi:hypothetical protein PEL8287_00627 [Roseovarius litorisediminis]|uniref:Uncharacterized protein n=1 Tax=Roseovarius litorisediminis TaxID=1312363 RepID=A0A1Y5RDT1_9RHOB|nr:hypothetical protein [Roseovarius litorisediminis]SLN15091.1 hypothetical protein PEL8287_00627 [Roseovarius litorisediminis]